MMCTISIYVYIYIGSYHYGSECLIDVIYRPTLGYNCQSFSSYHDDVTPLMSQSNCAIISRRTFVFYKSSLPNNHYLLLIINSEIFAKEGSEHGTYLVTLLRILPLVLQFSCV